MAKSRIPIEDVKEVIVLLKTANNLQEEALHKLEAIVSKAEKKKISWISLRDLAEIVKIYLKLKFDTDITEIELPSEWLDS